MASQVINWYKTAVGGNADYYDLEFGSKLRILRSVLFGDVTRKLVSGTCWLYNKETDPNMEQPGIVGSAHGLNAVYVYCEFKVQAPLVLRSIFYTTVAGDALNVKKNLEEV